MAQKAQFVGVTSHIPDSKKHWLLLDIDDDAEYMPLMVNLFLQKKRILDQNTRTVFYETRHGWHAICFKRFSFKELCKVMPQIPFLDQRWYEIGKERGYWFLISYEPLISTPEEPLSYMRIIWNGKGGAEWVNTKLQKS